MSRQAKKASSIQIASLQNPAALHLQRKRAVNANDPAGLGVEVAAGKGPYLSRLSDIGKSLNKSNSEQPNSKKLVPAKPSNSSTGSTADSAEKPKGAESPKESKTEIKQEAKHEPKAPSKSPDEKAPPAGEKPQESKKGEESGKKEKSPKSPEEDPAFQSVVKKAKSIAGAQKRHPEPKSESQKAMGAAKPPERERHTTAEAEQIAGVNEVAKEKPIPFSREAFKTALDSEIKKIHITREEEATDFKKSGAAASIKAGVVGTVEQSKGQSQGPIQGAIAQAPKVDSVKEEKPTELVTPNVGSAPPPIGAEMAVPKPLPNSEISMDEEGEKLDREMSNADITEEQLQNSNEPEFQNAVSEKSKAQAQIKEGPVLYRQEEQNLLEAAKGEAVGLGGDHMQSIYSSRKNQFKNSFGEQKAAKTKNEEKRAKVVADIEAIYVDTKKKVDERFKKMDADVDKRFDEGADNARAQFENTVSAVAERYSGISGEAAKLWDWATGPPEWVEKAFTDGRDLYVSLMEKTIDEVATIVEVGLKEAKDIIEAGWQSIQNYKSGLSADLVKFADEATSNIEGKFDALRQSVEDKFNGLVESLAKKYNENLKKVDDRVKQMKEDMRPGIAKAIDAIKGVIETISKLKDMLLGVLARIANVVTKIIKDPIGFVSNLVKGVKAGLGNFVGKIGEYLKQGLFEWLFGALGEAGIKMPDSLDFKGILSLVLQILGLTYSAIRARAVSILGENVVKGLETTSEIFITLIKEGPSGLWKHIQEKISDLKETVIEGIKSFLIEKVIIAGVTWIIGLLNPASAFIKAAKAIYDIVTFFVTRGSQIMSFVDALIDSMGAIAEGGIGVTAAAVEKALGNAVPIVIGFLAGLLGLGGISEKISNIIKKVQAPVHKAIDWVIHKAGSLLSGVASLGKAVVQGGLPTDPKEKLKLGMQAAVSAVNKFAGKSVGKAVLIPLLSAIRLRYGFKLLEVFPKGKNWAIRGQINPEDIQGTLVYTDDIRKDNKDIRGPNQEIEVVSPPKIINFKFKRFTKKLSFAFNEITEALQHHQNALNGLTISEWTHNIGDYPRLKKSGELRKAREEGREELQSEEISRFISEHKEQFRKLAEERVIQQTSSKGEKISEPERKRRIEQEIKRIEEEQVPLFIKMKTRKMHASHAADAIAGGKHDDFDSLERGAVNSYFGSRWGEIQSDLRSYAKDLTTEFPTEEQRKKVRMNFRLRANFEN